MAGILVFLAALAAQYARTAALAREAARLEQRRQELIAENARLRTEIRRLQSDDRYLEQLARRELGLVRPGEVELLIVPERAPSASAPETRAPVPPAPPKRSVVETWREELASLLSRVGRWLRHRVR